jgi:hypothetical protein
MKDGLKLKKSKIYKTATNREVKKTKIIWRQRRGFLNRAHDKEDEEGCKKTYVIITKSIHNYSGNCFYLWLGFDKVIRN